MQAEASFLDRAMTPPTYAVLARVSPGYPPLPGRSPTCYSPVRRSPVAEATFAHDLHVLSTPPAFILSQDQTLQFESFHHPTRPTGRMASSFSESPTPYPSRGTGQAFMKSVADSHFSLSGFQRTDDTSWRLLVVPTRRSPPRSPLATGRRIIGQLDSGVNPPSPLSPTFSQPPGVQEDITGQPQGLFQPPARQRLKDPPLHTHPASQPERSIQHPPPRCPFPPPRN